MSYPTYTALLSALPSPWPDDLMPAIREAITQRNDKIVVLDDDPTGTQTVHDVPVVTVWDVVTLTRELRDPRTPFFILTNTRSMPLAAAEALNTEIVQNLQLATQATGRNFVIVSRSDSTLRGHFPGETHALAQALDLQLDGVLVIPAFMAGGRYTIDDVHYVAEGEYLIPAAQTPFAQDAAFGYKHSNLREWVVEKCGGVVSVNDVVSISLNDIREGGPRRVTEKLMQLSNAQYCVVNAVNERDLEVATLGILQAEAQGKHLLYRTAASFAATRAGIPLRPLLTSVELQGPSGHGGLVIVGSYMPKTTAQLEHLLDSSTVTPIEVSVEHLLDEALRTSAIQDATRSADEAVLSGSTAVIYTSRNLITGADAHSSLAIGKRISDSLAQIVRGITSIPRFIIAKGGITSSDIATEALMVQRAVVIGQILPGIPVWQLGDESAYPGLLYIVFPGNVGDVDALAQAVHKLDEER